MTQEQFEARLRDMFMPEADDPEYERKQAEAVKLIQAAVWDTTQFAGGAWKDDVAAERFKQWEWLQSEIHKPKKVDLPESALQKVYVEYLKERGYTANKLPANKGKREGRETPDFLVQGRSLKLLNEFKAPELIFNEELKLYKFQTTHSKILTFVSKAVKQLRAEDSSHGHPWIVTFASTHPQLNWKNFVDTMQGGVAYDNKLSPDFTNTAVFKRVIAKAKEIDLYIWLQVSSNDGTIYQVSLIVNQDSPFLEAVKRFAIDMKAKNVSSMDNLLTLTWPNK